MKDLNELIKERDTLTKELMKSIKIRQAYNLDNDGVLKVQFVKPSGALMSETGRHIVRLLIDGVECKCVPLPEYNKLIAGEYNG
jgi:hypothetical protein